MLDQAHDAVISMDERGLVTYWNPSAERIFGIERAFAIGREVAELIIPDRYRAAHKGGLQRFLREGIGDMLDHRVELAALRADHSEFPMEMTITAVHDGSAWSFTAFIHDISERRAGERERDRLVTELRRTLALRNRRFDAVVEGLAEAITIRDRNGRIVYANPAAVSYLGFASAEELYATAPDQIMAGYTLLDEHDAEIAMDRIPSVKLLAGEPSEPLLVHSINRANGAERWSLLKASVLRDSAGEIEATIMMIEDLSEQKRAERRSELLASAADILASSLDYEQTLRNVAHLAVPVIADWCAVDLFDAGGQRVPVAAAHKDPDRVKLAESLRAYEPERLDPGQGLGLVFRTGEIALYPEITDEMLVQGARDERHLELLREVGFKSAAIVPMRIGRRTLGAMTLVSADSGRVLDRADIGLAGELAARAAIAIENAQLYSQRSSIAHTLQQSLLPARLPQIPGFELASQYLPARSEVGGDLYDAWKTDGDWLMVIGDVTGKGVGAAALTSVVRHTLRAMAEFVSSPAELLRRLDLMLKDRDEAICMRLHEHWITLAVGGHPLPICVNASRVEEIGAHGPLLGALEHASWHDVTLELSPGSALLLYTDGVTDARGPGGERFELRRLKATLDRARGLGAQALIDTLRAALQTFQGGSDEQADDIATLALRRLPV